MYFWKIESLKSELKAGDLPQLEQFSLKIAPVVGVSAPNCFELSVLAIGDAVILRRREHVRSI